MHPNTISPDDPRLTAYALNEMEPAERAEFEQLLQNDESAQLAVEEIRAAGALLEGALESEPVTAVRQPVVDDYKPKARLIRFPQFYYVVSGMAAACFAVFFVYWQRNQPVMEKKSYVEVDLTKFKQGDHASADSETPAQGATAQPAVTMALATEPAPTVDSKFDVILSPSAPTTAALGYAQKVETLEERNRPLVLDAFNVKADADDGYTATTTLAGTRLNTRLKDIGSAAGVMNSQFLADTSATASGPAMNQEGRNIGSIQVKGGSVAGLRFMAAPLAPPADFSAEAYSFRKDNDYLRVADNPLSTFSVDVDTAAYANVRRFRTPGRRPPADAGRLVELINDFSYHYAQPVGNVPFAASLEVASAPWAPEHRLVRIGLKGREVSDAARPRANLVFLLDVSGSMQSPLKLPLVKQSLRLLVDKLRADDRVAIAVYAGSSGLALPSTPVSRKADILEAIDRLEAGGSTNGALGIHLAYDIAKANFVEGGVNRVILATDGDFNVGTTSEGELVRLIGEKAQSGVFLSVLGFGMGNLKDGTLDQIADKGNGHYAYIDSLAEAKKALVQQAGGTLVTIAKDVKIQVEFNPAQVAAYRLIGYENRLLAKEDFNNDKVDAGEIGAGHTVTALYEIVPAGAELAGVAGVPAVDELKYQRAETPNAKRQNSNSGELLTVKVRYKEPTGDTSSKLEFPLRDMGLRFEDASQDFKFAAAVAGFGMALRDSPHKGSLTLADVSAWGRAGLGSDAGGYRSEFLSLVEKAQALQ